MTNVALQATGNWIATISTRVAGLRFLKDESGQDQIEYALVAALLSLGAVASLQSLSRGVAAAWNHVVTGFAAAI